MIIKKDEDKIVKFNSNRLKKNANIDTDINAYQDNIYKDINVNDLTCVVLDKISKAEDLEDIKKILSENMLLKYFLKNSSYKLNKIKSNLTNISEMLSESYSKNILNKLLDSFIFKSRLLLKNLDSSLYNKNYVKNNILDNLNSKAIMSDIIKIYLTKQETSVSNLQFFDNKLKECLMDIVYKNNKIKKNTEKSQEKQKEDEKVTDIDKNLSDIPYFDFDRDFNYSFFSRIRRFENQKRLVEKHRKEELEILDRKYGLCVRREEKESLNGLKNKNNLEDKDLKLNFNNCRFYQDKIYRTVNVFYNQKYNKIDQSQKQMIDEYKLRLEDMDNKQRQKDIRKHVKEVVREEYKIDLISNFNIKQENNRISEDDIIFEVISNEIKNLSLKLDDKKIFHKSKSDMTEEFSDDLKINKTRKKNYSDIFFKMSNLAKDFNKSDLNIENQKLSNTNKKE